MNQREARKRAHAIVYNILELVRRGGGVVTGEWAIDYDEDDFERISKALDEMAQTHYNFSDLDREEG